MDMSIKDRLILIVIVIKSSPSIVELRYWWEYLSYFVAPGRDLHPLENAAFQLRTL
jgi:hypothetical protein